MVVLANTDPVFNATPADYKSPMPSADSLASPSFRSAIRNMGGAAAVARDQAEAWNRTQRVLLRDAWTSPAAGGVRSSVLDEIAWTSDAGGSDVARGLFADVAWPASTSSADLKDAAIETGLSAAQSVLSAVPVVGGILSAAVGVGRFFWRLSGAPEDEAKLIVPWTQFSRDTDEDWVNGPIRSMMEGVDWSPMWSPTLDWVSRGFALEGTSQGANTRAFGVFDVSGDPRHGGGVGMMPGTEKIADVIQIAQAWEGTGGKRRDATTAVGSFLPSVSQYATGLWSMVQRWGGAEMYKVRAGELEGAWEQYFGALFTDGFAAYAQLRPKDRADKIYLSKCLAQFVVAISKKGVTQLGLSVDGMNGPYVTPGIFGNDFDGFVSTTKYEMPNQTFTGPACRRVRRRQLSALSRTVVCALVRPVAVGSMQPYGAFLDASAADTGGGTYGAQLRDECLAMRELLLTHPERYHLAKPKPGAFGGQQWAPDVRAVDPEYAARLEATFGDAGSLGPNPAGAPGPLGMASPSPAPFGTGGAPGPAPSPPGGGSPFPAGDQDGFFARHWRRHWWVVVGGGAAASVGAAVALGKRGDDGVRK